MIDKYLNKAIYILTSLLLIVSFLIAFLFVTPVYVHAADVSMPVLPVSDYVNTDIVAGGFAIYSDNSSTMYSTSSGGEVKVFRYVAGNIMNVVFVTNSNTYSNYRCSFNNNTQTVSNYPGQSHINVFDSDSGSYYLQVGWPTSVNFNNSIPVFNSLREGLDSYSSSPIGDLITLPQVDSSEAIDYYTVAANGANIYAGNPTSVWSFLGQYETVVSPNSQYCYVQTGENAYIAVAFSSVPLTLYRAFINGQTLSSTVLSEYESGKYYAVFNQYSTLDDISPIVPFESLSDAQAAYEGALSGGGAGSASGVVSAGAFSYDVPAGNVLYVRVRPGSLASVTVQMPYISNSSSPAWSNTLIHNYWAMGVNSLPDSNTTFPLSSMTEIVYSPDDSKGLDGYGRSYYGIAEHAPFNGGWFVVYNPAYAASPSMYGGLAGRTDLLNINPTITVNCQYALEYHLFPLSETLTVSGGTSSSDNDYQTSWSGTYDDSTDQFNDTSTQTGLPEVGGSQYEVIQQNNMSISDYLHQLEQTLSDFVNDVSSLLTAPVSHIRNLYNAGANFMTTLISLFSWLPQEVMNIIWSALIVMVAVGVLKLLL